MRTTYLTLDGLDPIVSRDSRPFGINQGTRMRSLSWLLPSVVAGTLRTVLIKTDPHRDFSGNTPQQLLEKVAVAGVFPVAESELYLPAPLDCLWNKQQERIHRVIPIPLQEGEGGNFPHPTLRPVCLSEEQSSQDFKAHNPPPWWPCSRMVEWLTQPQQQRDSSWFDSHFLLHPRISQRDHVSIDPNRGAVREGLLFSTAGLHLTHLPRFRSRDQSPSQPTAFEHRFAPIRLTARVTVWDSDFEHLARLSTWHPLGGERRLIHWHADSPDTLWSCPAAVRQALSPARRIRLVLATPAIFQHGWLPHWLTSGSAGLEGCPPGAKNLELRLVGVALSRWRAVSGWSLANPRGPKPIRRIVPAGSTYFLEVKTGSAEELAELWLQPVSDLEQDRRDGFGLALWGTW